VPPKKKITIVHSRDRFLPLYKQEMHDEIIRRLEVLGVEVILGERLPLPPIKEDKPGEMKKMKLKDGREIEYDYLVRSPPSLSSSLFFPRDSPLPPQMRCTGQKPNSELFRGFLPETLDEHGYITIRPTLQVDVEQVPDYEELSEKIRRNIYAIGDVRPLLFFCFSFH
jgi:thioredoxin reductase